MYESKSAGPMKAPRPWRLDLDQRPASLEGHAGEDASGRGASKLICVTEAAQVSPPVLAASSLSGTD
jgi:hypothetical protein